MIWFVELFELISKNKSFLETPYLKGQRKPKPKPNSKKQLRRCRPVHLPKSPSVLPLVISSSSPSPSAPHCLRQIQRPRTYGQFTLLSLSLSLSLSHTHTLHIFLHICVCALIYTISRISYVSSQISGFSVSVFLWVLAQFWVFWKPISLWTKNITEPCI